MKKYITPANIAIFIWGIGLLFINEMYYEYLRYYLYISIILAVIAIIYDRLKRKKENQHQ
ncbi:hypothetical protein [Flavobacterium sp. Root186]|jgi:hypothetical protein|uniref:hypothetical protein n=1 Tax=Flavobacterium sp. Root186 TaxID=1736485 RepID=UPI0006F83D7C|nr:hypothetical protein [Flavobacterium sp. Root186]KRB53637.1 hypothetical protein ASD98_21865 [Flavobacterium sp. Root186]